MEELKGRHMKVKHQIEQILKALNIEYTNIQHSPVYTMEEAEKVCNHSSEEGIKTLFLKSAKGIFFGGVKR